MAASRLASDDVVPQWIPGDALLHARHDRPGDRALTRVGYVWDDPSSAAPELHRQSRSRRPRCVERSWSVKPSARPALVRPQHVPPPGEKAGLGFEPT